MVVAIGIENGVGFGGLRKIFEQVERCVWDVE
jgi:hypothetical protein